jgi:hypothetical protein
MKQSFRRFKHYVARTEEYAWQTQTQPEPMQC